MKFSFFPSYDKWIKKSKINPWIYLERDDQVAETVQIGNFENRLNKRESEIESRRQTLLGTLAFSRMR